MKAWRCCCLMLVATTVVRVEYTGAYSGKPNPYTLRDSGLVEWQVGTNSLTTGSRVVAFADVNSDKLVDLIAVATDGANLNSEVQVLIWSSGDFSFSKSEVSSISLDDGIKHVSVTPGDFNYDGYVDLLVTTSTDGTKYSSYVYTQGSNDDARFVFTKQAGSLVESKDQLLMMDFNGDMIPDLFGADLDTGMPTFWTNKDLTFSKSDDFVVDPLLLKRPSAYADLSGDCLADLLFVANPTGRGDPYIGIVKVQKSTDSLVYSMDNLLKVKTVSGIGPIAVLDVDTDGHLDLVYTLFTRNMWYIVIHFNRMERDVKSGLCSAKPTTKPLFDDLPSDLTSTKNVVVVKLEKILPGWTLDRDHELNVLRSGDIDNDGIPELLVTVLTQDSIAKKHIALLSAHSCANVAADVCGSAAGSRPYFKANEDYKDKLQKPLFKTAAFFDLGENGISDVMVIDGSGKPVKFLLNNSPQENFFFKALVSNGVCPAWCNGDIIFPDPKPYGVSQTGVSVKFTVNDIDGNTIYRHGSQLVQSAYMPLQEPFSLMGIGRTNNYIEKFSVGVSSNNERSVATWTSMIPNSQMVVFPYPVDDPDEWTLELYVSPSANLVWVVLAVFCTSAVLVAIIVALHLKEQRADKAEQRRVQHFFTF